MNRATRSQSNRKRERQSEVDKNTSISYRVPQKQRKLSYSKMSNNNMNVPNIIDMSESINAQSQQPTTSRAANADNVIEQRNVSNAAVGIDPEVREMVVDETLNVQRALENRMKKMIQDEMADIKKVVSNLSTAVRELANIRSQDNETPNNCPWNNTNLNGNMIGSRGNTLESNRFAFNSTTPITNIDNQPFRPSSSNQNNNRMQFLPNSVPNPGLPFQPECINNDSTMPAIRAIDTPATATQKDVNVSNVKYVEKTGIRVDKWGLLFNGNNTNLSVEDFIFRLEHLQAQYGVSWEYILRDFHLLLSGTAKDWYWLIVRTHGVLPWASLRCELLNQYKSNISNFEITRDLVERKQQINEIRI